MSNRYLRSACRPPPSHTCLAWLLALDQLMSGGTGPALRGGGMTSRSADRSHPARDPKPMPTKYPRRHQCLSRRFEPSHFCHGSTSTPQGCPPPVVSPSWRKQLSNCFRDLRADLVNLFRKLIPCLFRSEVLDLPLPSDGRFLQWLRGLGLLLRLLLLLRKRKERKKRRERRGWDPLERVDVAARSSADSAAPRVDST